MPQQLGEAEDEKHRCLCVLFGADRVSLYDKPAEFFSQPGQTRSRGSLSDVMSGSYLMTATTNTSCEVIHINGKEMARQDD